MTKQLTHINQISLRYTRPSILELPVVSNPSIAIEKLRSIIDDGVLDYKEQVWVLLLTANNMLLGISEVNGGTVCGVNISPREIMQLALVSNAVGIILVHNHPSGILEPSIEDLKKTKEIREIGELMDIHLRDHLIITSESYISIRGIEGW